MKLVVLGGAGKTGQEVVKQALGAGHEVTIVSRSPGQLQNVRVVVGDARDADVLAEALAGQDAVISALGTMKSKDMLITRSTEALLAAAKQTGVRRVVMMSSFIISPNFKPGLMGKLAARLMRGMSTDKLHGEALLRESNLDWTIVYPTALDKAPAGSSVRVIGPEERLGMQGGIARADVAAFMLACLSDAATYGKSLTITSK